jgi:hypothetical protein
VQQLPAEKKARREIELPPEPDAKSPDAVRIALRLPSGARVTRLFSSQNTLQNVLDFASLSHHDANDVTTKYKLVTLAPRKEYGASVASQTLKDLGLDKGGGVLMVMELDE